MSRDEIQRQLDEDHAAVQRAQDESRRITATLERSQRIRSESLPRLRKAGRLR